MIQSEQLPPIKLRTEKQFNTRMAKTMEDQLGRYSELRRQKILRGLYRLAQERVRTEEERLATMAHASRHIRPRLKLYRRVQKTLRRAQQLLQKAAQIYAMPPHPARRPPWITLVKEAKTKVIDAKHSLKLTMGFLASEFQPCLVRKYEQKEYGQLLDFVIDAGYSGIPPEAEIVRFNTYFDHVRSRFADHTFILRADYTLKKRTTAKQFQRFKIIKALFSAAFGETVEEQTVRKVVTRYEEEKKRQLASESLDKNPS